MKKEVNPMVMWVALAVVLVVVIGIGYKMLGGAGFKEDKKGSEELIKKVQNGGKLYEPPIPTPGSNGSTR